MYSELQPRRSYDLRRPIASRAERVFPPAPSADAAPVDPTNVTPGMNTFVDVYHPAVRAFIGAIVREPATANELTQKFFLEVVGRGDLRHSAEDRRSGRFRDDLKRAVAQFLVDERAQGRRRPQSSGKVIHTDARQWRRNGGAAISPAHDRAFLRGWAQGIVATALRQVSESLRQKGKQQHFRLFVGRFLAPAAQMPTWRALGEPFALGDKVARNRAETAARQVRAAIRQMVIAEGGSVDGVDGELCELISLF